MWEEKASADAGNLGQNIFRMKCEVGIFLPFEVTGDITLMVFPHPPFFFF